MILLYFSPAYTVEPSLEATPFAFMRQRVWWRCIDATDTKVFCVNRTLGLVATTTQYSCTYGFLIAKCCW